MARKETIGRAKDMTFGFVLGALTGWFAFYITLMCVLKTVVIY